MRNRFHQNTFDTFNSKRVSYIIATKNRAEFLNKTLKMVKRLKKNNDELIVIDGLSSDSTGEVIKSYKNIIDKYISEPDISPTHAANKGILLASGKYIKTMSDDDIYYSRAMEKAIEVMENNDDIDILECGGIQYSTSLKRFRTLYIKPGANFGKSTNDIFNYGSNGAGYILRRSSLAKIGIFPLDIVGDLTFILNSIKNNANVKFCRIKLYKQMVHKTNMSTHPEISKNLYRVVKQFAPKRYYLLYACIYHIRKNSVLKILFYPLIFFHNLYQKSLFVLPKSKAKNKNFIWDGGFS